MPLEMFEENDDWGHLPHPPLSPRVHLVVEAAICATWQLMVQSGRAGFDLQTAHEDSITLELYERLYDEVFSNGLVAGFNRDVFTSVHREPKVRNFDKQHPDKMPDIFLDFVDRPIGVMHTQHGLFIECKPVDRDHPAGSAYCDAGLIRFVRGDYAWTMQSAMMIGYASAGYSLLPKLCEALVTPRREPISTTFGPAPCPRTTATEFYEQIAVSKHPRTFNYVENHVPAGEIVVRHLWLKHD